MRCDCASANITNGRHVSTVTGDVLTLAASEQVRARSRSAAHNDNYTHRHRIDKYLDTLLANQPISDGEATDRCQNLRRKMADCPS